MASHHPAGVLLAVASALLFAAEYLCIRLSIDRGRVTELMVVSLLTNVAIVVPLILARHGVPTFTPVSVLAFTATGLLGSLLARLLVFKSVDRIGASRSSPIIATNVFFATILAVVLFEERVTAVQLLGMVLIVASVSLISWEMARDHPTRQTRREIGWSLLLPLLAAFLVGVEPIFATIGLAEGTTSLSGFAVKAVTATTAFLGYLAWHGELGHSVISHGQHTKWYVGSGVASGLGIIAYYTALDLAPIVIVVPLFQTAPVFVVVLSALLLPERLERVTTRLATAAAVVVIGAILVTLP